MVSFVVPLPLGGTLIADGESLAEIPEGGDTLVSTDCWEPVALRAPICTVTLPPGATVTSGLEAYPTTGFRPSV
jgi:hypothetical protein